MTEGGIPESATYRKLIVRGAEISDQNPLPTGSILNNYAPSDSDNNNSGKQYFGFLRADGYWYIQVRDIGIVSQIRYVKGSSGYSTNWTGRTALSYDYFNTVFG